MENLFTVMSLGLSVENELAPSSYVAPDTQNSCTDNGCTNNGCTNNC